MFKQYYLELLSEMDQKRPNLQKNTLLKLQNLPLLGYRNYAYAKLRKRL